MLALMWLIVGTRTVKGAWRGDRLWMSLAQPAAWGQFAFLVFAFGCLTYAFMTDDFSVAYVANNSNSALPWYYKFSAVWGAHEGSLLLRVLCTTLVLTPIMTYWVLPFVTRTLRRWLAR